MNIKKHLTHIKKKLEALSYLINEPYEKEFNRTTPSTIELIAQHNNHYLIEQQLIKEYRDYIDLAIELNRLLPTPQLWCLTIEEIKQKDFITVKEFEALYSYGKSWQAQRRAKIHNPLPCVSEFGNKILYNHSEIKKWMQNELFR